VADFGQISRNFAQQIVELFRRVRVLESKLRQSNPYYFPPTVFHRGKAVGAIDLNDTGTVEIYRGAWGSETGTGVEVEAGNYFGDVGDDAWVLIFNDGDGWFIGQAYVECPE